MKDAYDVVIVGAATTGTYFGWIMAKKGHSVLIVDKDAREKVAERLEVIHFHQRTMKLLEIPPPSEPPELMHRYKGVYVSRLPLFLQRFYKIIEADGVELEFLCEFTEVIMENHRITGIKVKKGTNFHEIKARLVVDASGTPSVIRTSLPQDYGMETWKFDARRLFYVILHYIKWRNTDQEHPIWSYVRPYYFLFFDPGYTKDEAIMGIAGPESFEKAALLVEEVLEKERFPPFDIIKKEYGYFIVSRPPYSFVADGFFAMGDAAAMMHPIAARGIAETWRFCKNSEEVFDKALNLSKSTPNGYITRDMLWDVNVKHYRGEGADFAFLYMITAAIYHLSESELDFLVDKLRDLLDPTNQTGVNETNSEQDLSTTDEDEGKIPVSTMLKAVFKILGAIITGKLSFRKFIKFMKYVMKAFKVKSHYKKYPESPKDFEKWVEKAEKLWSYRKVVPRQFKTTTALYP